jgi:hypothetical protein
MSDGNLIKVFRCFVFVLFLFPLFSHAQKGKVEIVADSNVKVLLKKHMDICSNKKYIQGFRVHIFSESGSNSRSAAMDVKSKFMAKYSETEAYVVFQEPYYKVKVGNFRTRMNARGFLKKIIQDYPNAYVIKDFIDYPQE